MKKLPVPTSPADVALLLHEAVVVGHYGDCLVVARRRPHIPCGTDPADVNAECARRYVVQSHPTRLDRWIVREVDPADVVAFVDAAALIREADERANAAQRANVKPIRDLIAKSSIGEAMRDIAERGIDAHLADPRTRP